MFVELLEMLTAWKNETAIAMIDCDGAQNVLGAHLAIGALEEVKAVAERFHHLGVS